jgi:hypothetical protein
MALGLAPSVIVGRLLLVDCAVFAACLRLLN